MSTDAFLSCVYRISVLCKAVRKIEIGEVLPTPAIRESHGCQNEDAVLVVTRLQSLMSLAVVVKILVPGAQKIDVFYI